MTTATSGSFVAAKEGTYYVWIDVDDGKGNTDTSAWIPVVVSKNPPAWTLNGVNVASTATVGDTVSFSADITGDLTGVKYSYAWSYEGGWDDWSSTKKENGGAMTTDTSGSFVAAKAGTYYVWIDVEDGKGNSDTSAWIPVVVSKAPLAWTLNGVDVESSAYVGDTVEFSADVSGDKSGLKYNYAWSYEGGWDDWSSTKKETGDMTTATSGSFTASKVGTYHVWVDVEDSGGNSETSAAFYVTVSKKPLAWKLNGVDWSAPAIDLGDTVTFSAEIDGDKTGLKYNYAWSWEHEWGDNWDSTLKRTGAMTTDTSYTFTPSKIGIYYLWIDVQDSEGNTVTSEQVTTYVYVPAVYRGSRKAVTFSNDELGTYTMDELGLTAFIDVGAFGEVTISGTLFGGGEGKGTMVPYDGAWAVYEEGESTPSTLLHIQDGDLVLDYVGGEPSDHFTLVFQRF